VGIKTRFNETFCGRAALLAIFSGDRTPIGEIVKNGSAGGTGASKSILKKETTSS
jgi:hypothetical protein